MAPKNRAGTPNSRSSFGGPFCNPYDTERSPGTSSGGSGSSVAANLVTCSIGEETGGSIHHPAKNNSLVGLAPTQELVSRPRCPFCPPVFLPDRSRRLLTRTGFFRPSLEGGFASEALP
jgi:Asp-tRNA(Asn)/Glu-tRNA(Gln) amidotransferase A subunit family amidase